MRKDHPCPTLARAPAEGGVREVDPGVGHEEGADLAEAVDEHDVPEMRALAPAHGDGGERVPAVPEVAEGHAPTLRERLGQEPVREGHVHAEQREGHEERRADAERQEREAEDGAWVGTVGVHYHFTLFES